MFVSATASAATLVLRQRVRISRRALLQAALLGSICLLPILLYVPFMSEPFFRDEGVYASVGQLILDGGIPYRDAFDNKPPLIYGWYAFSFVIFGQHIWAPRLMVSLLLSITTLLVYVEGRLVFSRRAGLLAAAAFALSVGLAGFETNANTEYFMLLPMVGALVAFTVGQQRQQLTWYLLAGFLSGLAIMTKETSLFNFAFLVAFAVISTARERRWRELVYGPSGVLMLGCTMAFFLVVLPFVLLGAFGDFFDAIFIYTSQYVGDMSLSAKLSRGLRVVPYVLSVAGPWILVSILGIFFAFRNRSERRNWLLVGWLAASAAGVAFPGRFASHYFVQLLPAMSLLTPAAIYFIRSKWRSRAFLVGAYSLFLLSAIFALASNAPIYLQSTSAARHEAKYPNDPRTLWEVQSQDLATYLRQRTDDDDFIYNLGLQTHLYFYSHRRSPTRYMLDTPFSVDRSRVQEALADLEDNKPLYIIDSARYEPERPSNYYAVEIKAFIDEHYDYVGKIYYADVYLLKDTEG